MVLTTSQAYSIISADITFLAILVCREMYIKEESVLVYNIFLLLWLLVSLFTISLSWTSL